MSRLLGMDSAIGWAHFRLRNGWKTPLIAAASYAAVLAIVMTVSVQSNPTHRVYTLGIWRTIILVLQSATLILLGGSRINNAIRGDITQRLVESHRLMPMSPAVAVSGYLWGPNLLPLALASVGFVLGAFATAGAKLDQVNWAIANAVLLSFALFCWTVTALAASQSKAAGLLVFIGLSLLTAAVWPALAIAPAAVLLNGPMLGQTIYSGSFDPKHFGHLLVASSFTQLLIGGLFFIAVARKYRWPGEPALATLPALGVLLAWVAATIFVISHLKQIQPAYARFSTNIPLSAGMLTSMLIAVLPISNTVRSPTAHRAAPMIALACAAIIAVLFCMTELPPDKFFTQVSYAGTVLGCYCIGLSFLLIRLRGSKFLGTLTVVWLLLTWLGPVGIDFARWLGTDSNYDFEPTAIMGTSPIGALARLFNRRGFDPWPGVMFQFVLCAGVVFVSLLSRRRKGDAKQP